MSKKEADFAWLSRQFEEIKATLLKREEYLKFEYEKQIEGVQQRLIEEVKFLEQQQELCVNIFKDLKTIADRLSKYDNFLKVLINIFS